MNLTEKQLRKLIQSELELNEGLFDFEDSQVLKALGLAPEKKKQIQGTKAAEPEEEGNLKVIELGLEVGDKISEIVFDYCYSFNVVIGNVAGYDIKFQDKIKDLNDMGIDIDYETFSKMQSEKISEFRERYFKDFDLDGDGEIADLGDYEIALLDYLKTQFDPIRDDIRLELETVIEKQISDYRTSLDYESPGAEMTQLPTGLTGPIEDMILDATKKDKSILEGQYVFEEGQIVFRRMIGIIVNGGYRFKEEWAKDPREIKKYMDARPDPDEYRFQEKDNVPAYRLIGLMFEAVFDDVDFHEAYVMDDEAYKSTYEDLIDKATEIAKARGKDPNNPLVVNTRKIGQQAYDLNKPTVELTSEDKPLPYRFKDFRYEVFSVNPKEHASDIDKYMGGMDSVVGKTFLAYEKVTNIIEAQGRGPYYVRQMKKKAEKQAEFDAAHLPNPIYSPEELQSADDKPVADKPVADKPVADKPIAPKEKQEEPFSSDPKKNKTSIKDRVTSVFKTEPKPKKPPPPVAPAYKDKTKFETSGGKEQLHNFIRSTVSDTISSYADDLAPLLIYVKKVGYNYPERVLSEPYMYKEHVINKDQLYSFTNDQFNIISQRFEDLVSLLINISKEINTKFESYFGFDLFSASYLYDDIEDMGMDKYRIIRARKTGEIPDFVTNEQIEVFQDAREKATASNVKALFNLPENAAVSYQYNKLTNVARNIRKYKDSITDIFNDTTAKKEREKAQRRTAMLRQGLETSVQKLKGDIEFEFGQWYDNFNEYADNASFSQVSSLIDAIEVNIDKIKDANADRAVRDKMKQMKNACRGRGRKEEYRGAKDQLTHVLELSNEILTMSAALDPAEGIIVKESFRLTSDEIREIVKSSLKELL